MGRAKRDGRDGHSLYETHGGGKYKGDHERRQQRESRHIRLVTCRALVQKNGASGESDKLFDRRLCGRIVAVAEKNFQMICSG